MSWDRVAADRILGRRKEAEHEVIVYCKAHHEVRIIEAIDIVFKRMRQRYGTQVE